MGIIHNLIFGRINTKAHARILVRCPRCLGLDYVFANVTLNLEVIEPDLKQRVCKECEQVVDLIKVKEEDK